jgi:ribonuclease Y
MIDDAGALNLARDISRKIEKSLSYPGSIKVTVLRERRAVHYAS